MSVRNRIVVKIGSSLLANDGRLTLRYAFMHGLLADIAQLREEGYDVVLASSGSVALGLNAINKSPEEAGVLDKQAAAACGQPLLLKGWCLRGRRQPCSPLRLHTAGLLRSPPAALHGMLPALRHPLASCSEDGQQRSMKIFIASLLAGRSSAPAQA